MNKFIRIGIMAIIVFSGCKNSGNHQYLPVLIEAEQLAETDPDSTHLLLLSIENPEELSEPNFAKWCLISGEIYNERTDDGKTFLPSLYFEQANRYYKRYGTNKQKAFIRLYLGRSYQKTGEYDQAMHIFTEALKNAEAWKEYNAAGMICRYMGDIYQIQYLSDKSKEKYKESIHYFNLANNLKRIAYTNTELGFEYFCDEKDEEALNYLYQADSIADILQDSALIGDISYYLGLIHIELGEYIIAEQNLLKALRFVRTKKDSSVIYFAFSDIPIAKGNYIEARDILNSKINDQTKYGISYQFYLIEKGEQNFKQALNYLEKHQEVSDSIQTKQKKMHTLEIEQKYNLEHAENVKNRALISSQRNYIVAFITSSLTLLLILILQFVMRKKNRIISQQQQNINKSDLVIKIISGKLAHEKKIQKELEEALEKSNQENAQILAEQTQQIEQLKIDSFHVKHEKLKYLSVIGKKILKITEKVTPGGKEFTAADWQALKELLLETYPSLNTLLWNRSTPLTDTEIRQCMITFFNLGAKGEAIIMNIMPDSIYKQRTRLRQKLFLEEGESIFEFLKAYCIEHE